MLYRKSWVGADSVGLDKNYRVAFKDDKQSFGRGENWLAQNSLDFKVTSSWSSRLQIGYTQLKNTVKATPWQCSMANRMYLASSLQHALIDDGRRNIRWLLSWGGQARHEQAESQPRSLSVFQRSTNY